MRIKPQEGVRLQVLAINVLTYADDGVLVEEFKLDYNYYSTNLMTLH